MNDSANQNGPHNLSTAVYVMTNSRSLDPQPAAQVNREVVAAATSAAEKLDKEVAFVSRSDSTLRGHFPWKPTRSPPNWKTGTAGLPVGQAAESMVW